MREFLELRVAEEYAGELFAETEGKLLGTPGQQSIRKVIISTSDPRLPAIRDLQARLNANGRSFFYGWDFHRRYTPAELSAARVFHVAALPTFEPEGEECGTAYDESTVCPICKAGRQQCSPLRLDVRRIPRRGDWARSIADDWVVSARLAKAMRDAHMQGIQLDPVQPRRPASPDSSPWYQLRPAGPPVDLLPETRFGIGPFDDDTAGQYRCPVGCISGLNLLSDVHVAEPGLGMLDFAVSKQRYGVRRGQLVPRPLLLISPRLRALLVELGVRGCKIEVAQVGAPSAGVQPN
ncbi:MAG TPA: hypothetical protein VFM14_02075 [Gemmatimonadales bacterium]|nr:hypothetical protein [Gemmatimonadales bacterium]